jgi:hypothetical protein
MGARDNFSLGGFALCWLWGLTQALALALALALASSYYGAFGSGPATAASGCSQLLVGLHQQQHMAWYHLADAAAHKLYMMIAAVQID